MRKSSLSLLLLLAALVVGGFFIAANRTQAAPVQQDTVDAADTTVFLPFISSQNFVVNAATPLLPEQYDAESENEPTIDEDLLQASTCSTYIKFSNSSSYSVNIYWVNSAGGETLYKTLSSQSAYWQQTYWGHSWRVRTTSGTLLKSVTASSCFNIYVYIYNSDFPQPTATPTKTATPAPALGSIGDRVWNDANRNGVQDNGEVGISNVSVTLWVDSNNDGNHDTQVGGAVITNANGNYSFTGLNTSKRYVVKFTLPTCFVFTTPNVGSDVTDSDVTQLAYNGTDLISLATTRNTVDVDAGMYNNCLPTATPTATNTAVPQLGSIGDFVWNDLNRNGIQEAGEPGASGVVVDLLGCGGNFIRSVTTNGTGGYSFTGLTAGCYLVRVNLPGGFQFSPKAQGTNGNLDSDINIGNATSDAINLAAGQNLTNVDAGINQPVAPTATPTNTPAPALGSIGDFVWNDLNRNGIQEAGEPGASGVVVDLLGCGGNFIRSVTTNGTGGYSFTGLAAGCYLVRVNLPGGFQFSPKAQGTNGNLDSDINIGNATSDAINLAAGQNLTNVDAGINQPVAPTATPTNTPAPAFGSIGDRVWNDTNGNGVQDAGENGVPNVSVILRDCAGNTVQTTTTNASGIYSFANLAAGCYVVRFANINTNAFVFSPANLGGNESLDSDVTAQDSVTPGIVNGNTDAINLAAGQNLDNVDAGLTPVVAPTPTPTPAPALGSIGDRVWNDTNGNGVQDAGENGIANVLVTLKDCSGNTVQTQSTNGSGLYSFTGLAAGCYTVSVDLPGGFTFSPQDQGGNDNTDSDINPATATTTSIVLNAGQNRDNVDAGLTPQGGQVCLGDRVWRDSDFDGLQDVGEPNLSGIEVYLGVDTNLDGRIDGYRGSTTTNGSGIYQFCGLDPNTPYLIEIVPPPLCGFTLPNVGNDDTIDSDANISKGLIGPITVNQINNTYDAGITCHD